MSVEENKALERQYFELANQRDLTTIAELLASDFVFHGSLVETRGREAYVQSIHENLEAFPDAHYTVHDIFAEGDKVVARWTLSGTHTGEFKGIPPTRKKISVWGIDIERFANGKFVEGWARIDTLGMMQQLGLVPTPKK